MALYMCCMCQCGLHAVLWSHIGILMILLAVGLLFNFPYICGRILLFIRWGGTSGFQEQGQCIFIGLAVRSHFVFHGFPFLFFLSVYYYCGVGVLGLIWFKRSLSLALPTFLNNNNNNNKRNSADPWRTQIVVIQNDTLEA